ncbi:MAG TPA: tetratricopeptide repeat protein [Bryobacteraceae bacterium]|nr:tetratricopeptide repeat protein [Bryobacteraceae bacterium]
MRRAWITAALFSVALCADSFPDVAARAQHALAEERVPEAIALYERAVILNPGWPEGFWRLGTLLFDTGQFTAARAAFAKFTALEPRAGPGVGMLGLCEFQLKSWTEAANTLEHSRRLGLGTNRDFARRILYSDAILHSKLRRPELALRLLTLLAEQAAADHAGADAQRAVLSDSELIDAIGIAALRMPMLPQDIPPTKTALIRQAGRARVLFEIKDWVAAGKEFNDLVKTWPAEPGVHYLYGLFLLKVHPDDAFAEFRRELELSPGDVDARVQIALVCLNNGDHAQARRYVAEAVRLQPGNFAAHIIYGRVLLALGNIPQAIREAQTAVRLAPRSPEAHLELSRGYARARRTADADRERMESERLQAQADPAGA